MHESQKSVQMSLLSPWLSPIGLPLPWVDSTFWGLSTVNHHEASWNVATRPPSLREICRFSCSPAKGDLPFERVFIRYGFCILVHCCPSASSKMPEDASQFLLLQGPTLLHLISRDTTLALAVFSFNGVMFHQLIKMVLYWVTQLPIRRYLMAVHKPR